MKLTLLFLFLPLLVAGNYLLYRSIHVDAPQDVFVHTATSFNVPVQCSKLGLLGCTPHPANYLKAGGTKLDLKLSDFIDIEDLKDSFTQALKLCEQHHIDHLLIAYLPIYFVETRSILKERFVPECQRFFQSIGPQIKGLIASLKKELNIAIPVTLIIPSAHVLERVPTRVLDDDDRIRYSIKQFPILKGINESSLNTIIIINNQDSDQNEQIISYLKYEYLFEKKLWYLSVETKKKRFHKYL